MPGKNERREKSVAEIGHESTEPDESENQPARNAAGEGKTPSSKTFIYNFLFLPFFLSLSLSTFSNRGAHTLDSSEE